MRLELYVYYHVAERVLPPTLLAASAMQARLAREHPGLECRLLRRPHNATDEVTLMEIYRHPAGIDARLEAAITAAMDGLNPGATRHVEHFTPL